jgi:hypothetical protein
MKLVATFFVAAFSLLIAQVEIRSGTYNQMVASTNTRENAIWMLVDANTSSVCTQGGGSAKAVCIKNAAGVWESITAGGGAAPPAPGGDTTIYGGFTGGGSTVVVSDDDCDHASDDTSAVATKLASLATGGTLDFQNETEPCDITTASALSKSSATNIRITTSVTPPADGTLRMNVSGLYSTPYSSMLYLSGCTNCLVDKIKVNGNGKAGQAVFLHHGDNNSVQNIEVYGAIQDDTSVGAYAAIKGDDETDSFFVGNNLHDFGGDFGGEGYRGLWIGVGGEYSIRPTIRNNTVTTTGHSGIVTESQGPVVTGNLVTNVAVQGTCFKFIPRGAEVDAFFDNNTCDSTKDGGFQFEPSPDSVQPNNVYFRNNQCKNVSTLAANTFGCFYISGSAGGGSFNLKITGNIITNTKAIANVNNGHNILFQNNTIISPNGGDGNNINLENDNDNITSLNSGNVNIHSPACDACFNIFEDGIQLAFLPSLDRNTILAFNSVPWTRKEGE